LFSALFFASVVTYAKFSGSRYQVA
jgi:hypothetical protein